MTKLISQISTTHAGAIDDNFWLEMEAADNSGRKVRPSYLLNQPGAAAIVQSLTASASVLGRGSIGALRAAGTTSSTSIYWTVDDAATNEKSWEAITLTGGDFFLRAIADDYTSAENAIEITRGTGAAVASVSLPSGVASIGSAGPDPSVQLKISTALKGMSIYGSAAGSHIYYGEASHASFAGNTIFLSNAVRAANSAFNFLAGLSGNFGDTEFVLRGDGEAFCDGSWTGGGADYAEYFETFDGKPIEPGVSVVLEGTKIRPATGTDNAADIIGAVSANPTVIGDAAWNFWSAKYLTDDYGAYHMEDYAVLEWEEIVEPAKVIETRVQRTRKTRTRAVRMVDGKAVLTSIDVDEPLFTEHPVVDEAGRAVMVPVVDLDPGGKPLPPRMEQAMHREPAWEIVRTAAPAKTKAHSYAADEVPDGILVPDDAKRTTQRRRKLNPRYDSNREYVPREKRPEWVTVGLMGKLRIRKGQPVGDRWIKMRDISDTVEEWLVR